MCVIHMCMCVYLYVLNILLYFCSCFRIWKWSRAPLPLTAGDRILEWLRAKCLAQFFRVR